jgi:bis(5'-nucleosidyl)-tetraphosphatase
MHINMHQPTNIMPGEKSCGAVVFRTLQQAAGTGQPAARNRKQKTSRHQRVYLLLHYEEGHWDFPKGHVEAGESETETMLREAEEETGISDLEPVFGFRERIEYFYKKEGRTMHKEVWFFAARTRTEAVKLSSEHVGFAWLPYEKALERLTYGNARGILKKAEKFLQAAGPDI